MKPKQVSCILSFCSKVTTKRLLGVLLVTLGTPVLFAQVDRAVLEGTVTDPSERVTHASRWPGRCGYQIRNE
jgi:hypothetical protein